MDWIAGVDGCPSGWIAAIAPADDISAPRAVIMKSFNELLAMTPAMTRIAVDMPIGLPDRITGSGRAPEQLVRPLLGPRRSSVFSIPSRAAVEALDYREGCALAEATSDPPRKFSKQGFHLFPRIREIDALLRADATACARTFEVHPEVAFQALNGGMALSEPKKRKGRISDAGMEQRRRRLAQAGIGEAALMTRPPRGAGMDDWLDALVCLVTARAILRGQACSFPQKPLRDRYGLPIAIWSPLPQQVEPPAGPPTTP